MAIKLQHRGVYLLKGVEKPQTLRKSRDGRFWYDIVDEHNSFKTIYVTEDDVVCPVYISYNGLEIKVGDIVIYIKQGWNCGASIYLGQVEGMKDARVTVRFGEGKATSNIMPDNLFVVTDSRIREEYKWLK